MKSEWVILTCASVFIIALLTGVWLGIGSQPEHQIITIYQKEFIDRWNIEYVPDPYEVRVPEPYEVKVPEPYPVEVIKEVPLVLEDWDSVEELEAFLLVDNPEGMVYLKPNADGVTIIGGWCEDRAMNLRDAAAVAGKNIEVTGMKRDEWEYWWPKIESLNAMTMGCNQEHALCSAIIRNEWWYIEPSTDEIWWAETYMD